MSPEHNELEELKQRLAALTQRVYRLEQQAGLEPLKPVLAAPAPSIAAPPAAPVPAFAVPQAAVARATPALAPVAAAPKENLESRIGAHWLNRIGIAAMFFGGFYFLKWEVENDKLGAAGRISLWLLIGIGVIVWSEVFRKRGYRIFSFSLKAVGISALYLSLWAAFQTYHLIPGGAAFFAMAMVTAATATLALRQDAELLAAYAIAGGFTTPLLLSTGQNRELELFAYVAVLDLGALVLTAVKPWRRLLIGSFVGTLILYVGWYGTFYHQDDQLRLTFAFATVFFVLFAMVPLTRAPRAIADTSKPAAEFLPVLVILALANAAAYFLQIWDMLEGVNRHAIAWISVGLAVVYLVLFQRLKGLYKAGTPEKPRPHILPLLHVALATGFLAVAIPMRMETHWVTIGWFIEAGVLLWIADRTETDFLRDLAIAALGLGVIRLLFFDNFYTVLLFFNARMATYGVAIAVLAGLVWHAQKRGANRLWSAIPVVAINLLALVALTAEISDFFSQKMTSGLWVEIHNLRLARDFTYSALWMVYGAGLLLVGFRKRSAFLRWQALILIAMTVVKVFVYDVSELEKGYRILSFIILGVLLLGVSFVYQKDWLKLSGSKGKEPV
ncbi:MAG TPA: DUF2339 domain-containing protein [Terriglobales bacterium]|nr:DUF2339 domain-containing protein [Terriglobales bacterium]